MVDQVRVDAACEAQSRRQTAGIEDIERYLADQVGDMSHREVTGPLLSGSGASGVVLHHGDAIAQWGDPDTPEMLFSATKSLVSLCAGVAFDRGLLEPRQPVSEVINHVVFSDGDAREITWEHLLQQRSGWEGVLWGKPSSVDAQSQRDGPTAAGSRAGTEWAYNDVRVNLNGMPVAVGGAHWGGGLFISAADLALVGELLRREGRHDETQLISRVWCEQQWTPCPLKPDYGYLWWLNSERTVFATAPPSGICARGNGGRHLLWIDPARELVITSHWGDDIALLLEEVSLAIEPAG